MASLSVLLATKNERGNLERCLSALTGWADEIVVVDSQSTDGTIAVADEYGATVVQFVYAGGWPKKRQWALDTVPFRNDWILILDADEILTPELRAEIDRAICEPGIAGYRIQLRLVFLGRLLRFGGTRLWKLCLVRRGAARYELRLKSQDSSMADMEIHEHVIVNGAVSSLDNSIRHINVHALDRYIQKHNEYSTWEARAMVEGTTGEIKPSLFGTQAARRRWAKRHFMRVPGSPFAYFIYMYVARLGFLDGVPGLLYSLFKGVQLFHVKAKIYEIRNSASSSTPSSPEPVRSSATLLRSEPPARSTR